MKKRWVAKLMAVIMCLSLLPVTVFAEEPEYVAWIGEQGYPSLEDAVKAAPVATSENPTLTTEIRLETGTYTLYDIDNSGSLISKNDIWNKNITFVGVGNKEDETVWLIGPKVPDPDKFGTEYNADYSFDVRPDAKHLTENKIASTITFKNMRLETGSVDYLGFVGADNTVIEDCVIDGKTFYWGYTSATFKNTTFNAPEGDYAIWTYCSPIMTFEGCTFNVSGKAINVYRESEEFDVEVNYKDCTVISTKDGKAVMNINDSLMGDSKFTINISGTNTVSGLTSDDLNKEYRKEQKDSTCSKLFEFNTKYGSGNSGRTIIKINDTIVWQDGKMVDHKNSDGYEDNAFDVVEKTENGIHTITKTCRYCGYTETMTEVDWDFSKSKEATNLNSKYESTVTLSLPSAEKELVTDVVFVLDKSTSTEVVQEAKNMLENLKNDVEKTGATVKVGVVIFNKEDHRVLELTELNDANMTTIENAIANKEDIKSGTNTHAGLLAGKAMLDEDTKVDANRKYMIFVSDGITYIFDDKQGDATSIVSEHFFNEKNTIKSTRNMTMTGGNMKYPCGIDFFAGTTVSDYLATIETLMSTDQEEYWVSYDPDNPDALADAKTLKSNINEKGVKTLDDEHFATYVGDDSVNDHANNVDTALYLTNQVYQAAMDAGYHCYAVSKNNKSSSEQPWADTFMKYLANGETVSFDAIQQDILYLLGPDSTIVDEIGNTSDYNFDLVVPKDKCPFTLTVGGTPYVARADGDNAWKFYATQEDANNGDNYKFQIAYDKTDTTKETITWNINTNVSNLAPVQLTYTVKLTNPKTDSGTYGTYDQYGNNNYNGLYTNNSAVLYPVDSQDNDDYLPDEFLKPTVSYTVSGGHNGGGHTKPPVLNKEDHYAYIVGYPDGTVKPQGNITRAEVATIFFRMLTDDSRNEFWSQTNSYSDVSEGQWFNNAISTLANAGILSGYPDGTFRPNAPITRAEFTKIAASFFERVEYTIDNPFNDVDDEDWFYKFVMAAYEGGLITGYPEGDFRPNANISRAESVTIVNRTLERAPDADHFLKDMIVWPDNAENAWYYEAVQEATNSHEYVVKGTGTNKYEEWTKILEVRDWPALEKEWSDANSAAGGEVVK